MDTKKKKKKKSKKAPTISQAGRFWTGKTFIKILLRNHHK